MWWHMRRNQISSFARNRRVHLNRPAGASVQSTTGSRGVRISGSNAGYTMFRGSVKGTGYPLHSPVSPFTSPPWVTVCHHISTGICHQVEHRAMLRSADTGCMHILYGCHKVYLICQLCLSFLCKHHLTIRVTYPIHPFVLHIKFFSCGVES